MTKVELLENINIMRAEIEWEAPIDYAATLDICKQLVIDHYQDTPDLDCAMRD